MNTTPNNPPKDCPSGQVCFYEDFEYQKLVRAEAPTKTCTTLKASFKSVYNNSGDPIFVYDSDKGCWGDEKRIEKNSGESRLSYESYSYKVEDN
ncbi:hypothetical protein GCM10010211_28810 [Streptomyces albospinus]|uniref:Uncharacterized protein n=1 Tax=Streptomyces albospinus TaxID=285515 RepID=A0ABQ2V0M6_9ACTN|nr:peptidase inhibitor family I36 protein [Streptomyces albospinus]GGU62022.1 hypothetical protein GCM10010211_28810 [Streptomyces albospinus]